MKNSMKKLIAFAIAMAITFINFGFKGQTVVHADNSIPENAIELKLNGDWINGSLENINSVDWYKVTIPSDGFLTINWKTEFEGCFMQLHNSDLSNQYAYTNASGSKTSPGYGKSKVALDAGTYRIKLYPMSNGSAFTGKYQIKTSFEAANNNDGHGNRSFATAMNLPSGQTINGFLSKIDNTDDFYRIHISKNQNVEFNLKTEMDDVDLIVYNSDQTRKLIQEDAMGHGTNDPGAKSFLKNLNAGTYYIRICSPWDTYQGRYSLKITYPVISEVTMYRAYNPNSGEHFYTKDKAEFDHIVSLGWNNEGIGWIAPEKSNTPVYRLYNANGGEHHYTTNVNEKNALLKAGWKDEGIGWYSDDQKRTPLYRQYNPNAFANNHNYTTSKSENDYLVSLGWKAEGIGWYGVRAK